MIENPPYLFVDIGNNIFVADVQYLPGQYVVPVIHQPLVLQVVLADIREVVTEALTFREQLFEAPEATIEGMAACVD